MRAKAMGVEYVLYSQSLSLTITPGMIFYACGRLVHLSEAYKWQLLIRLEIS